MYHGPNLLDRSSVVNLGNACLPRFTFGCFYCTPGFGSDDPVIFHTGGGRLLSECFECLSSVSYSSFALGSEQRIVFCVHPFMLTSSAYQ